MSDNTTSYPGPVWQQQSPINLVANFSATAADGYLNLSWGSEARGFRNCGEHGVEVVFGMDPDLYLDLERKRFHLKQFHFHHPSEHLLEARTFDAEIHIVHQNLDDLSFAVVGIFLTVDRTIKKSKETTQVCKHFQHACDTGETIPLRPDFWLPDQHDRVLRYEGSLTTDPYTESVSWIMFRNEKMIPVELFSSIFGKEPQKARSIQPRNRRFIIDLLLSG